MKNFKNHIMEHLSSYKENVLNIKEKGIFRGNEYRHILPVEIIQKNFLSNIEVPTDIHLHMYAHHLNSSQVMCINFFDPLVKNETGKSLFLEILKTMEIVPLGTQSRITEATFEKVINFSEGTNFDFYLKLDTGEQIFFEIKYTEDGFGKTHPDNAHPKKYETKWEEIYKSHLANSLLLQAMDKDTFYKHYQIWRNVSYIQSDKDYTVFLYPYDNEKAHSDINETIKNEDVYSNNVKAIDWNSLVSNALKLSKYTEFHTHFDEFYKKYLAY